MSEQSSMSSRFLVRGIAIATVLLPVLVWGVSVGNPLFYFFNDVPPGQTPYILSKLCGMLALSLFWLQCMAALARFSPALCGFVQLTRRQHIVLGLITFLFVVTHLGLFIAASTLRTGNLALALLLPKFGQGFYNAYVSLGAIAFWFLLVAIVAGWLRSRGRAGWRWVHASVFLVFTLGFLHGISIGSETRFGLMSYVYAFIGLSVTTAVVSWIRSEARRRRVAVSVNTDSDASGSFD
ncbi:MAG TPA: hypothetical protein VKB34_21400 [Povalibacter sp.]|nr:hypothetical protein [Povalibacter sp.]